MSRMLGAVENTDVETSIAFSFMTVIKLSLYPPYHRFSRRASLPIPVVAVSSVLPVKGVVEGPTAKPLDTALLHLHRGRDLLCQSG